MAVYISKCFLATVVCVVGSNNLSFDGTERDAPYRALGDVIRLPRGSGVARGGPWPPPKLLVNVFLWNELMLLRALNV